MKIGRAQRVIAVEPELSGWLMQATRYTQAVRRA
jgi:hypothetical protein